MTKLQHTLDISKEWKQTVNHEINSFELARIISKKLSEIEKFSSDKYNDINMALEELIVIFRYYSNGFFEDDDFSTFDDLMESLYNWGDITINPKDSLFNQKKSLLDKNCVRN